MSLAPRGGHPRSNVLLAAVLASMFLAPASPTESRADTLGFGFLIEDGVAFQVGTSQDLTAFRALNRPLWSIVNGQKGAIVGTADVFAWSRSVPDPFFTPIGPFAALGVLRLPGLEAHLGLIETPAGIQTTIGVLDTSTSHNLYWRGSWLIAPGTLVGGDADDVVVAGTLVVPGAKVPVALSSVEFGPRFPSPPFSYDVTPFTLHGLFLFDAGSFYGQAILNGTARPLRTFSASDTPPLGQVSGGVPGYGHLVVVHGGADDYLVVACSQGQISAGVHPTVCTVSGTGAVAGGVAGNADYALNPPPLGFEILLDSGTSLVLP